MGPVGWNITPRSTVWLHQWGPGKVFTFIYENETKNIYLFMCKIHPGTLIRWFKKDHTALTYYMLQMKQTKINISYALFHDVQKGPLHLQGSECLRSMTYHCLVIQTARYFYVDSKKPSNGIYSTSHEICIQFVPCHICCGKYWLIITISLRVTSLALGQSYDCPSASEVTLKDMDKKTNQITTTKQSTT